MSKIVVLMGPTAIGKTDLSLDMARDFSGEIINADASQFKKELNIGTAKIDYMSLDVMHHLLDVIGPEEHYSVKDYQIAARQLIKTISAKKKLPILVGGSGLYIKAVIENYQFSEAKREEEFAVKYASYTNEELHSLLEKKDYLSSKKIHANNRRRVLRALEIAMNDNKLISENIAQNDYLYDTLQICLITDRTLLYERINERVKVMLENGWIEEIKALLEKGIKMEKITDIGYLEIAEYLNGQKSLEQVIEVIKQKTRKYAKRQMTWFRNKMNCYFVEMDYENPNKSKEEIYQLINEFIKNKE